MSVKVFIALGANLGNPAKQMNRALDEIETRGLGKIVARSHLYRSEPVGFADQDWFINAAAQIQTELDLRELMQGLLEIEADMGRDRENSVPNGPRLLDLDIVFAENLVIDEPDLQVPHPRAHLRGFVMHPVAEIDPDFVHPVLGLTARDILDALEDPALVEKTEQLL